MNTVYTAFDVLKHYIESKGLKLSYMVLNRQSPSRVEMWVEENEQNIVNFVCIQESATQFLIWGYADDYSQILATSFNYADVNTPLGIKKID